MTPNPRGDPRGDPGRDPGADRAAIHDLLAEYGALLDGEKYDEWLDLFAAECRYNVVPRENYDRGLPAALIFCDSRAMLEDRIRALREANKFNIHKDRHLIGLPRIIGSHADGLEPGDLEIEAPFAVYQTDQEGETRLFATGLYRDRLAVGHGSPRIRDKLILLDTFAVPSLLATPL
jgi:anthranilate 1,2-dioxygenase small subunit